MKKMILRVLLALLLLVLLAAAGFGVLYAGRLRTVNSIEKITDYSDYNLYRMDVRYDYSIDDVINYGITDNQSMIDAMQIALRRNWDDVIHYDLNTNTIGG